MEGQSKRTDKVGLQMQSYMSDHLFLFDFDIIVGKHPIVKKFEDGHIKIASEFIDGGKRNTLIFAI